MLAVSIYVNVILCGVNRCQCEYTKTKIMPLYHGAILNDRDCCTWCHWVFLFWSWGIFHKTSFAWELPTDPIGCFRSWWWCWVGEMSIGWLFPSIFYWRSVRGPLWLRSWRWADVQEQFWRETSCLVYFWSSPVSFSSLLSASPWLFHTFSAVRCTCARFPLLFAFLFPLSHSPLPCF